MNGQAYVAGFTAAAKMSKQAGVDAATAAGVASLLGGGALAGSTVDDDESALKRLGKATAAAGLAYGGYKALTDPRVGGMVNAKAEWLKGVIRSLVRRV